MKGWQFSVALLVVVTTFSPAAAEVSRFVRTVVALQRADASLRADFAEIALLELTEIYLAEASLARSEALAANGDVELHGWSRAVERFAEQLLLVQEDVAFGLPVELRQHYREVPAVSVAGRTVMLAHPRRDQQAAFEQRVLAQFCASAPCSSLTGTDPVAEKIPVTPVPVTPAWSFSPDGPLCSYHNLSIQFPSGGDIGAQRLRCSALMQEAEALAAELAWQSRHEVTIDWSSLVVRGTPHRPEHLVQLNAAGDSLLLSLPVIHATPGLLPALTPWLRQRHAGGQAQPLALQAAAFDWD